MKKIIVTTFIFIFFYGCESFVENADSSVSYVTDDEITRSDNISFLVLFFYGYLKKQVF